MRMIKKVFASILTVVMILGTVVMPTAASSYKDVADGRYYSEAIEALTTYGIISGYDGNFRPTANVTRAEFAKIAALISGLEDEAYSNAGNKKFDDVALEHWATGYINTVSANKIIVGYPDGSFQPERNITFAEAVTVVLRTLNYSAADLGDNWPYAYMVKADGLGLTDGLNVSDNSPITRADLCVVVNRALRTSLNGSSEKLISKMDINTTDDLLVVANKDDYTDAVVVKTDIYEAFASVGISKEKIDNATVIRNGKNATLGDVEMYDVAYFHKNKSLIYVYSDKVSGVYNEAFPTKANVTSVDISGTTLQLETQTAANKLGEKNNGYKIGSRVTALLGMEGKIVDIVDLNSTDVSNYGILLSFTTEMSDNISEKGKQYNYITLINGEGNTMKYKTTKNYDDLIGYVGKLSFDDEGYAEFTVITSRTTVSGTVDKNNRKIGDHWLTNDCVIIERVVSPFGSLKTGTTASVVDFADIVPTELNENNVIHAVTSGNFDDICVLFVENVTTEQYQYGILKSGNGSSRGTSISGTYEVFSMGKTASYSTNFYNNIAAGSAVAMTFNGNSLASINKITTVETVKKVVMADYNRIKVGSNVYKLADDVQIIKKKSSEYTGMSKYEIEDLVGKSVSLFADRDTESGGQIRVILVLE